MTTETCTGAPPDGRLRNDGGMRETTGSSAIVDGFAHAAANTDVMVMDQMNDLFAGLLLEPEDVGNR
ncbi:hypothetical protein V4U86_22295 [Mycobacterium sp. AMU20-3851]|uniref:hypothetical protein n=1 Tax=Mycobacterium sp. AMU20-3851 TaxID=3122055 RepID=UPI003754FD02